MVLQYLNRHGLLRRLPQERSRPSWEQVHQLDGATVCRPSDPTPQRRIENQSVAHATYCSGNVAIVAIGAMAIRSSGRVVIVWISLHRTGPGMVFGGTAALCEGR